MYIRSNSSTSGFQGASYYTAPNPPYGATMVYYLKEAPKTKKQKRQEAERDAERKKQPFHYATIEELRAEAEEEPPALVFTITDADGKLVRRISAPAAPGVQRVTWDFRYSPPAVSAAPAQLPPGVTLPEGVTFGPQGALAMPGKYNVTVALRVDGKATPLPGAQSFNVVAEGAENLAAADRTALADFQKKVSALQRAISAAGDIAAATKTRISLLKRAAQEVDATKLAADAEQFDNQIDALLHALRGNRPNNEIPPPSINERINTVAQRIRFSTGRPTQTQTEQYNLAAEEFKPVMARLRALVEDELPKLEKALEKAGAPLTPGRLPDWNNE